MTLKNGSVDEIVYKYAKYIDHTLLKADTTSDQIANICYEAKNYHFASVCVNPWYVKLCAEILKNTDIKVSTVVGFPLGMTTTEVKRFESHEALKNGAKEIDMVMNIGALKGKNLKVVQQDIQTIVSEAHPSGALVKVIIETCLLTQEEKITSCEIVKNAGADFVKTSTGFSTGGATVADVALMKRIVGPNIGVKASTGIRTLDDFLSLIKAGATRFGTSAGIRIIDSMRILYLNENRLSKKEEM